MSLLHLAAAAGEAAVLARLLPLLPPSQLTEQRNPQRATPLHCAAELLGHGPRPHVHMYGHMCRPRLSPSSLH